MEVTAATAVAKAAGTAEETVAAVATAAEATAAAAALTACGDVLHQQWQQRHITEAASSGRSSGRDSGRRQ